MILSPDFNDFIKSLNDNDVRYLIVGGYAVALHGHPRYTKDMDVWIERDESNAARMIEALRDFGFGSLGLTVGDFLAPDRIIQLGYAPNRIDILTTLPGVEFDVCHASRIEVRLGELPVATRISPTWRCCRKPMRQVKVVDPHFGASEFKACAVKVERA